MSAAKGTEGEKETLGFASEVDCVQKFMAATEKEIRRLQGRRRYTERRPLWYPGNEDGDEPSAEELLKCAIPNSDAMDRLLRYESSLERAFGRTLTQQGQLQRMCASKKIPQIGQETTATGLLSPPSHDPSHRAVTTHFLDGISSFIDD